MGMTPEQCEKQLDAALKTSTVRFMMDALRKAGCPVDRSFFRVEKCEGEVVGGFRPPDGVVLCHNGLQKDHLFGSELTNSLVHELVHAFDHCRAANLSWQNCRDHACSEVRAAHLSGDCAFGMEFQRGNFNFMGQQRVCVRRRAELSVAMNPDCAGLGVARAAIDGCFDACMADTAPFDRAP